MSSAQLQIEKQRLEREVSLQEELFKTLKRELELARISEKKEASAVSIIDRAVPPEHPSRPRTMLNVLLAAVVGFMLAVGFAFAAEYFTNLSAERADNREFLANVQALRNDFRRLLLLKPKPVQPPPAIDTGAAKQAE